MGEAVASGAALESRYRARSLWLDGLAGTLAPRQALPGDVDVDVAIVGGGFTGLWTAYALVTQAPRLRIAVVEAEIAGYGPSGRNGGFVSAGIAGEARVYARAGGVDGVRRAEQAVVDSIDWIGRVVAEEEIACGYVRGGSLRIATSEPQLARVRAGIAARRERGLGDEDVRLLTAAEIGERVRVAGALGGSFTPHCARIDPARLARGLADACERHGVTIYERTRARRIGSRVVESEHGRVRADVVVRATESYTTRLPGERRRYLPIYSHMLATEPLPSDVWDELGWSGYETVADQRYLFFYAQRTPDDRIAIGGEERRTATRARSGRPTSSGQPCSGGSKKRSGGTFRKPGRRRSRIAGEVRSRPRGTGAWVSASTGRRAPPGREASQATALSAPTWRDGPSPT